MRGIREVVRDELMPPYRGIRHTSKFQALALAFTHLCVYVGCAIASPQRRNLPFLGTGVVLSIVLYVIALLIRSGGRNRDS